MNKGLRTTIIFIIIVLAAALIFYPKLKPFVKSKLSKRSKEAIPVRLQQQPLTVSGLILSPEQMSELVKSIGTLHPDEEVDLSFETSGKIVNINFQEGTRVKKGDLLAKINDRPLQAQLEKLLAQKKFAEQKEFRQRNLLDKDAISQENYDQIQTEVQALQADINLITARISETELRAPFDGIIGLRYISEGAYATPSTKIARLVKISPIKIEFSIPERYEKEIKIGYPIKFSIDGVNSEFNASVYAIDPKIELNTRTLVLRALYPNRYEELKPGRYAGITLTLSQIKNAVAIPTEALIAEIEGEKVFVNRSGRAQSIKVETGLRTESKIQIKSGLKFGDTLLITGILQLRQGLPLRFDTIYTSK
ncbi:MAG TPA: efflux RND transporter periplasmic adaptor subunit [Bacteroidales bacterium]|nr:efflux RND transporter periplasmic adaptor subunit [Bacteroidales bacterium]HCI55907.1 efflux transporter periplasmic adaptor subunit [Bacteroidales bacterium]HOU95083.1 efflux RND transporter periplasmic adaptor subunit [Bacteroidales bacterium]HQG36427.1 efflux RND transporter periplasmic adaptor subunit [Bacteroidales bacterium]HQG53667.1 efflux RND transporter periplasmic adaptor subunit [Bacteroidales bacterium]